MGNGLTQEFMRRLLHGGTPELGKVCLEIKVEGFELIPSDEPGKNRPVPSVRLVVNVRAEGGEVLRQVVDVSDLQMGDLVTLTDLHRAFNVTIGPA